MDRLQNKKWIVYAKPPFGGPAHVLRYLGRYTHRIAISNHRLLAFDGQRVTFRYKDYAHGSKQRIMTLDGSRVPAPILPPRAAQRLRAHPPFRAALQPFPKPEPDAGTNAAGSRWLPSASATATQNPSRQPAPLALSQMRRSHVCGAKTDCGRAVPIKSYRFVMTLNTNPDPRLAPCTPTHSCLERIPVRSCHRPSLSKSSARQATTYLWTHPLPSTSRPIHAPQNPYTGPQTSFNIHRSQADHRVRLERLRLPSSLLIETASNHRRAFP